LAAKLTRCTAALAIFGSGIAIAQDSANPAPASSFADTLASQIRSVFDRSKNAVVQIQGSDEHGRFSGTGFFVDPAGTLYTSYTIGGESDDLVVCHRAQKYPARRLFADRRSGIAVLKLDAETPFLTIGDSNSLDVGSPVLVVGYAMDLPLSPNFGTVAGMEIKFHDRYFATRHIRANVPVQRGQGGAPLVKMKGEVVGVLISSLDQGSACFSLPIEAAEKIRKDYVRQGDTRRGFLGIAVEPAPITPAGSTAAVGDLSAGSPGDKAGLKPGDIILQINNHSVSSPEDVLNAAFFIAPDDDVKLRIARGKETVEVSLTAEDPPNSQASRTAGDIPTFAPIGGSDLRGMPSPGLDVGK
jgi:serine protease Do